MVISWDWWMGEARESLGKERLAETGSIRCRAMGVGDKKGVSAYRKEKSRETVGPPGFA